MDILNTFSLESNKKIQLNFDGGDLSSDSGLFLMMEFLDKLRLRDVLESTFKTEDRPRLRKHTDVENLLQVLYQIFSAYFEDDRADHLRCEPVMTACTGKETLASQPTLSRFFNRMTSETAEQLNSILQQLREIVYSIEGPPTKVLFDIDTTLLETYGHQEGEAWNFHYQSNGYHPVLCFNGLNGDLLCAQLRNGTDYCCTGVAGFMRPILEEFHKKYPYTFLMGRADSGFATPELYDLFEEFGVDYTIRLKDNSALRHLAEDLENQLWEQTKENKVDHAEVVGEFQYQAGTWSRARRVAVKIEKPANSIAPKYMFVVTSMPSRCSSPELVLEQYCGRGNMENFIKECKEDFDLSAVSSRRKDVNECRMLIRLLAYNLANWFRRLVLPAKMRKDRMSTIRLKLVKIASRVIHHGRKVLYKLCSSCYYKEEFLETMDNIHRLHVRLT